jgi:hypothetical protein
MICLKPNFSLEQHSEEVNLNRFKDYDNVDELILNIKSVLGECSFSTDLSESEDSIKYEQSINLLIDYISENVKEKDLVKERLKEFLSKVL